MTEKYAVHSTTTNQRSLIWRDSVSWTMRSSEVFMISMKNKSLPRINYFLCSKPFTPSKQGSEVLEIDIYRENLQQTANK